MHLISDSYAAMSNLYRTKGFQALFSFVQWNNFAMSQWDNAASESMDGIYKCNGKHFGQIVGTLQCRSCGGTNSH
jgi:hypothetical protein